MEAGTIAKFDLLRLLIFDNFKEVLWLNGVKSWHKVYTDGNLVRPFFLRIPQRWNHHVNSSVVEIVRSTCFAASHSDVSSVFILFNNLGFFWYAQVADSPRGLNTCF